MRPFLAAAVLALSTSSVFADVNVVASIKPIHSLVATVMQGHGTPSLIVAGNGSPHTYSLKPSDANALQNAAVIFWVGPELESFLEKPLDALGHNATTVSLLHAKGIKKIAPREGGGFEKHEHEGEIHSDDETDAHIWLDPENAKVILLSIAETLSQVDPANAAVYNANAVNASVSIDAMSAEIATAVAPVKGKGFIVFHDAYHYFEKHFNLEAAGAISVNPENPPGAQTITALRQRIADGNITCVFAESQFDTKLVDLVLEGSNAKAAVLDPEGANIEPGPLLYENLMRNLATSLVRCLTQ
jgi:zinc transport system substrate-binding protein